MATVRKVVVDGVPRLPAFSHAAVVGDQVLVSGILGTSEGGGLELAGGGVVAQTRQSLRTIETVLQACGARLTDVAKVNVYLTDMADFAAMNEVYVEVFGTDDPPARITIGCAGLALGAAVEIDCIAFLPDDLPA
jgi:2-iminobutanoate/2-iminopropanoate deaminase